MTGAAGAVGASVLARVAADPAVGEVLALDRREAPASALGDRVGVLDRGAGDLAARLHGVDVVLHLAHALGGPDGPVSSEGCEGAAPAPGVADRGGSAAGGEVELTRRVLGAAAAGVGQLVVVSSATVYGAWPSNPVPLTEAAPVRPNGGFPYAVDKAEVERLCAEWRRQHPGAAVAVLRPAATVGQARESWLARMVRTALALRSGEDPPAQFLHVDDLASAVDVARRARLDGVFNVAPDGWVDGEEVRALAGAPPRLPVPAALAGRLAALAWRWRLGPAPPGVLPYTRHPWVVANDRLKAAGWSAAFSNEEAFVAAHAGTPWSRLSPRRRQELAVGVAGTAVVAAVGAVLALLRRAATGRVGARGG